jgi:hypothetical protein
MADNALRLAKHSLVYSDMCQAVDAALVPDTKQPIVFNIEDRSRDNASRTYDYELYYYPANREIGLRVLQLLNYTLAEGDDDHHEITGSLGCSNERWPAEDGTPRADAEEEDERTAYKTRVRAFGTAEIGRIVHDDDLNSDALSPFLYHQICALVPADDDDDDDDRDDDDSECGHL